MARLRTPPVAIAGPVLGGWAELVCDLDRPSGRLLVVDGVPQSYVDLDDPCYLDFHYVQMLAAAIDVVLPAPAPVRALHIGAGGATLPRWVAATRAGSRQVGVDVDGPLLDLLRPALPTPSGLRLRVDDGRAALEAAPAAGRDLIVLDAFSGAAVPPALTTRECFQASARALGPHGLFALNIADGAPLSFARRCAAGVAAAFATAAVVAEPAVLRGRRFGNLVLLGSAGGWDDEALVRRCATLGRVVDGDALTRFTSGYLPVTDATAGPSPVPPPGVFGLAGFGGDSAQGSGRDD